MNSKPNRLKQKKMLTIALTYRNILSQRCCWHKMSAVICSKWALSNDVLRENRPGGKNNASKEKGCQKEKALTAREQSRVKVLQGLSTETPFERFFIVRMSFLALVPCARSC